MAGPAGHLTNRLEPVGQVCSVAHARAAAAASQPALGPLQQRRRKPVRSWIETLSAGRKHKSRERVQGEVRSCWKIACLAVLPFTGGTIDRSIIPQGSHGILVNGR